MKTYKIALIGGDGTGPQGLGPMTGRAAGFCAGYPVPGYMNSGRSWFGRRRGRGWGKGFGWGFPEVTPQQEADMLKEESKALQEEIKSINDRIRVLETAAKGEKE